MNKVAKIESAIDYWTPEQVGVLKRMIAPGLNGDELAIFSHICKRVNLDPFAKQIYGQKRGGRLVIVTGIDGFRLIAERTGKYAPGKDTEFIYDEKGNLNGAKVFVKKQTPDGTWHEVSATALLGEYNANQGCWKTMPHVMIEKCAEARALRRAFPADLSGIYSQEEMDQAATEVEDANPMVSGLSDEQVDSLDVLLNQYPVYREKVMRRLKSKYGIESLYQMPVDLYGVIYEDLSKKMNDQVYGEQLQMGVS